MNSPTVDGLPDGGQLLGPRRGLRRRAQGLVMIGPAFAAAIAYVDPGNFATNFAAGSDFGYRLLWVVVAANTVGMLVQFLSAKLGLATGRNLAQACRERYPRPVVWGMWVQAELVAMATDLAEVIGGAVALSLLFDLPLAVGGVLVTALSFVILAVDARGRRKFEAVVAGCLACILMGFGWNLLVAGVPLGDAASGLLPTMPGSEALLIAGGIVGATVMPHVVYLHSDLARRHRTDTAAGTGTGSLPMVHEDQRRLLWQVRLDVVVALAFAGVANMAMLVLAARLFHGGPAGADTLEGIHAGLGALLGGGAAVAFAAALLASGLASSAVGTYAGQVIMAGFLRRSVPLVLRRLVTVSPALVVLLLGIDPTQALIWSQLTLSFGIPFVLIPLVGFTRDKELMGPLVNTRATTVAAGCLAAVVVSLNVVLAVTVLTS
ncbi:Nramp family divalent metal transporter [Streptomyces sp. NPDC031705]|uniref:Nramp family divalent metal transporter n=1 Tax=Streptomyces sp. NPDC031705 TaxID=3155729 RepID=UPI003403944D